MKFNYLARTKEGQIQKGIIEASSEDAALAILQKYGFYLTALEIIKPAPIYAKQIKFFTRISGQDIALFTRQLAIMFQSQVPIVEALTVIAKQASKLEFKEKIVKLAEEVEGGVPLSSAFSLFPKIFSSFFVNMVKSGEASGKLSESLEYLADHLEKEYNFKNKLRGAMIYPILVFAVFLGVIILMIYWVLPPLMAILKETNQELPLITKAIIFFSDVVRVWGWALALALVGFLVAVFRYLRTSGGKQFFDRNVIRLPLIGQLMRKIYLTRFAENLATLIVGGLHIAKALEICGDVVGNEVYKSIILKIRDEVRKGETISSVLDNYPQEFPPLFVQMVVVGEKTGRVENALGNIINFYQKEVDRSVDNLISLIEPIMLVILGAGVAGLLAAILLPIYQIGTF